MYFSLTTFASLRLRFSSESWPVHLLKVAPCPRDHAHLDSDDGERSGQQGDEDAQQNGRAAQVPPLRLDAVEVVALDDGLHAGDDRILDARVVEVGVAERRGDVVVRPFDVALFEEVRGQREQRLVLLDRQPRVGQGRQLQEAVLPLPVAGFAVEFGQAHRRHGVAVRVGSLSAVDFREDPFGLLQSPVGLQLEGFLLEVHFGVFGQQRHDRVAQRRIWAA